MSKMLFRHFESLKMQTNIYTRFMNTCKLKVYQTHIAKLYSNCISLGFTYDFEYLELWNPYFGRGCYISAHIIQTGLSHGLSPSIICMFVFSIGIYPNLCTRIEKLVEQCLMGPKFHSWIRCNVVKFQMLHVWGTQVYMGKPPNFCNGMYSLFSLIMARKNNILADLCPILSF